MQKRQNLVDYAIILTDKDNVATALVDMPKGEYVFSSAGATSVIVLSEDITAGFKVSLTSIRPRDKIYKYGYPIGEASVEIRPGDCVHTHNMASSSQPSGA